MTTPQSPSLELLSALADGELTGIELEAGAAVFDAGVVGGDWNTYHVIGHALRGDAGGSSGPAGADPAFLHRFNARLANESVGFPALNVPHVSMPALSGQLAANESVFRWKLVAGLSSVSAALVVAWSFVGAPDASTASQLSQRPATDEVVVSSSLGPIVRDARLEELMAAHKQLGGSSLQAPSGFLRNAAFEDSRIGRR